jgi:hypothetical protein
MCSVAYRCCQSTICLGSGFRRLLAYQTQRCKVFIFGYGWGDSGPTLEIFTYRQMEPKLESMANCQGLAHLAFEVDDVFASLGAVGARGGRACGELGSLYLKQRAVS